MNTEHEFLAGLRAEVGDFDEPYVVCWRGMDPQTKTDELERLDLWVGWFLERYRVDHKIVPPCWSKHGALIEELSALRTFWEACYLEDASPSDPVGFHRDLDSALRRLREWSSRLGCSRTSHRPELNS